MSNEYEDDKILIHGANTLNPGLEPDDDPEFDPEGGDYDDFDELERPTCPVCGKELKLLNRRRVVRGLYICNDCENKAAVDRHRKDIKKYSAEDALDIVKHKIEKAENFTVTKSADDFMLIDDTRKLWTIPYARTMIKNTPKIDPELIFRYDEIENYSLVEDGNQLAKGGRGLAPVGGLLFGSEGGGFSGNSEDIEVCESLQIRINLSNIYTPKVFVNLIVKDIEKDKKGYGQAFLTAQKILSILEFIVHKDDAPAQELKDEPAKTPDAALSPADEIKKYKELLDMGAITQEEYDAKKAKLLDL